MACPESPSLASKLRARMLKDPSTIVSCAPKPCKLLKDNGNGIEKTLLSVQDSNNKCLLPDESCTKELSTLHEEPTENYCSSDAISCQKGLRRTKSPDIETGLNDSDSNDDENADDLVKKKKRMTGTNLDSDETRLSEEELSLARSLSEKAKSDEPPTPSHLKLLGVKCLVHLLRYNDRPVYPGMDLNQLAHMVLDYTKHGCPPPCPKCAKGKLKFSNGKKKFGKRYYWCPGFTNNGKKFYGCNFKADRKLVTRVPWNCP